MGLRSFLRGLFWTAVGLAVVFHLLGGWYFSGVLIEDAFVTDPDPVVLATGDFQLEEVTYATPMGGMDAWYLPAPGSTWVIHVHGKGATPAEGEHLFPVLQEAGYPQLSLTYRNDEGQPEDPSGHYQYGATEWEDIAGAMEHARMNGATNVVFLGFSTGGAHILSFAYRHNLDRVKGIILDSPNLDMSETVDFAASKRELPLLPFNVPPTLSATAKFMTSLRIGVNWRSLDYVSRAEGSLRVPVLVIHGTDDETIPVSSSVRLAETAPDLVGLVQFTGAGHVGSYESDSDRYLAEVLNFLQEVG
jgi:uncharacterized protein